MRVSGGRWRRRGAGNERERGRRRERERERKREGRPQRQVCRDWRERLKHSAPRESFKRVVRERGKEKRERERERASERENSSNSQNRFSAVQPPTNSTTLTIGVKRGSA